MNNNLDSLIKILASKTYNNILLDSKIKITQSLLASSIELSTEKFPTDAEIQQNADKIIGAKECLPPSVLKYRYLRDPEGKLIRPPGIWDTNQDGVVDDLDASNINSSESLLIYDANKDGVVDILDASEITAGNAPSNPYSYNGFIIEGYCEGECDGPFILDESTGKCDCRDELEPPGPGKWVQKTKFCDHNGRQIITYECPEPYVIKRVIENGKTIIKCECNIISTNNNNNEGFSVNPDSCEITCNNINYKFDEFKGYCICELKEKCIENNFNYSPKFDPISCSCNCPEGLVPIEDLSPDGQRVIKCKCPDIGCSENETAIWKINKCTCECLPPYIEHIDLEGFKRCCIDKPHINCNHSSVRIMNLGCPDCVCNKQCPPNSTPYLYYDHGQKSMVCDCKCGPLPKGCEGKRQCSADGTVKYFLSPIDPLIECTPVVPAKWIELPCEPCSCLCKDKGNIELCQKRMPYTPPATTDGFGNWPYSGKIDPRTCECEKICSESCTAEPVPEWAIFHFLRNLKPYGPWEEIPTGKPLYPLRDDMVITTCNNIGMCCVPRSEDVKPSNPALGLENPNECSAWCDPEGKKECCSRLLVPVTDWHSSIIGTFCCEECEECVNKQHWDGRCVPKKNCSGSYSVQSASNISNLGYNIQTSIESL